ncbi:FAS1-like dehydratase domain-containing protein [Actinomadura rupiterrae]|uniref:FAS1-like dehydratase domain-containing protein n=1 Tax=Actinomadura rupiterrae TaxID=559627 RepID=UPI0020A39730|nr:MaoC family dehydratase N-terminal domain-containing protein [Actinomadura rupiterrae]MCP2341006.1 3-methylfumaryl-CoA hydratase [Actinomadura rupiterrae]
MIDIQGWDPSPHETTEILQPGPAFGLAGLLGAPFDGDELPPLWQWLYFLERPPQSVLGPDGHPAEGRFLPPIPNRRRMFAGGRFLQREPLRVGDTVTRRDELVTAKVKQGRSGELLFVTVRQTFLRDGQKIAVEEQDLMYRSGAPDSAQPEPSYKEPLLQKTPWRTTFIADPVLLFRFSALTYNSHRIHYDEDYATNVEGHAGLVVHGPLLAILLLELPRMAGHKVTEFSFRARHPVYAGQPVAVAGHPDGELAVIAAAYASGPVSAVTATFS